MSQQGQSLRQKPTARDQLLQVYNQLYDKQRQRQQFHNKIREITNHQHKLNHHHPTCNMEHDFQNEP